MQNERRTSKQGWRWTNGQELPTGLIWKTGEPGNYRQSDCLKIQKGSSALGDAKCFNNQKFICQPLSSPTTSTNQKYFKASDVLTFTDTEDYAHGACTQELWAGSRLSCAACCTQENNCVAFYFNRARFECRIIFYTDASVDVGSNDGWQKFVQ